MFHSHAMSGIFQIPIEFVLHKWQNEPLEGSVNLSFIVFDESVKK